MDLKYRPQLGAQLTTTLLRVLALGGAEDAGVLRDTLVKKQTVLRRALHTAQAALDRGAAPLDETLPEDPFGTAAGAAKAKAAVAAAAAAGDDAAAETGGGGGGDGDSLARQSSFGVDTTHEDTAVGGASGGGGGAGGSSSSHFRTSSASALDMSALAKSLSPTRSGDGAGVGGLFSHPAGEGESDGVGADEGHGEGADRTAMVLSAAAGLARMYRALGGAMEQTAVGYGAMAGVGVAAGSGEGAAAGTGAGAERAGAA
jgi:hypothetical protein